MNPGIVLAVISVLTLVASVTAGSRALRTVTPETEWGPFDGVKHRGSSSVKSVADTTCRLCTMAEL